MFVITYLRISSAAVVCLLCIFSTVVSADVGNAAGKDINGNPLPSAVAEKAMIVAYAETNGSAYVWVDMYHPFNKNCTRDEVLAILQLANEIMSAIPRFAVRRAKPPGHIPCAPGFAVMASASGVELLWRHVDVRSIGQLSRQSK